MKKNIIFDVDGTLWDSAQSVAESWNYVLSLHPETRGIHLTAEDEYRFMGHTMYEISVMMLPDIDDALRGRIMQECMENENTYLREHPGAFYPEMKETFTKLKESGKQLYIVSNCQDGYIQIMMEDAGLQCRSAGGNEDSIITDFECYGRTILKKADNIRLIMERNSMVPEECVYVGDTAMDEQAARDAGISFIHAAYGFGEVSEPDGSISSIAELPELLLKM